MKTYTLLETAKKEGNPVISGNRATFIWQGKTAPHLIDDIHMWENGPQKMKRIEKGVWGYSIDLPDNAYLEYSFYEPKKGKRVKDPLNKNLVFNGIKHYNHFFYMPGSSPTPYAKRNKNALRGKITRHMLDTWILADNSKREIHLYHPPVKEPVPLLLVYDGTDYLKRAMLNVIVDNLIHEKKIRPIAMAFVQNGQDRRGVEYACSDATIMWLDYTVLPFARKKLNLLDPKTHPGTYGVLGASFGGLMSIYTGLRMPEIFGNVFSQSGVFASETRNFAAVDLIKHRQSNDIKIHMSIGLFDWLLEDNRRLHPILQKNGYNVTYHEFAGAHNYNCWRDDLPNGLEILFGTK